MNGLRLLANEIRLLSRSVLARVFLLLIAILGAVGVIIVPYSNELVVRGMNVSAMATALSSAQYAALSGSALFAMLTLLTLSRDQRARSRDLLGASQQYTAIVWARIGALLIWACLTVVCTALAGWLSHLALCDAAYRPGVYLFSYAIVSLPALVFSIMICGSLYLISESLDISFITYGMLYMLGFSSSDYLLRWVQGGDVAFSDFGGIEPVARYVVYNRLFWACVALTILLAGQLLQRRAGCGLLQSLVWNVRGVITPILFVVMAGLSVLVYHNEPYQDANANPLGRGLTDSESVRLREVESRVTLYPDEASMAAEVRYVFEKDPEAREVVFLTNVGLQIESAQVNGNPGVWERIPETSRIRMALPSGSQAEVKLAYRGTIRVPTASSFTGYICPQSIYLLEASYWLFRPLAESLGRVPVSGSIVAPRELTVVTPGRQESVTDVGPMREWKYRADTPRLNLGLFAADYQVQRMQIGQLEVEFYFSPQHAQAINGVGYEKYIRSILEFYQKSPGAYPFEQWPIKLVEVPFYKPGGHVSLNVVTVAEYVFNRRPLSTTSQDMRFILGNLKLLAHELAHQWWAVGVEVRESGGWTSEGLTEYTAYRYMVNEFSESISPYIVGRWEAAVEGNRSGYYVQHPEVLKNMRPEFIQQVTMGSEKIQAYSAMPLKLLKAETYLGLEEFSKRLSDVYRTHQGGALSYDEFLAETGLTEEVLALD